MGGVFAVSRAIFDHEFFAKEPFTEREAWLWLIGEASWKPRRVRAGSAMVNLARGQCAYSIRFMADRWGWSKSRVSRFLGRLKSETMIGTEASGAVTLITLCNYDEYQKVSLPVGTLSGTPNGTETGHQRDKEENRESSKGKNPLSETEVSDAKPSRKRNGYPPDFQEAWSVYPTDPNMSKAKTFSAWSKLAPEDRPKVAAGIPGFIAYCRAHPDYRPLHMVRFITERRFDGYIEASTGPRIASVEEWQKRLAWARPRKVWSTPEWGPAPGLEGCLAPQDLLGPDDKVGWQEWRSSTAA